MQNSIENSDNGVSKSVRFNEPEHENLEKLSSQYQEITTVAINLPRTVLEKPKVPLLDL